MPSPETISTRPSGNVVAVGYQRPRAICGPSVHEPLSGLSNSVFVIPT
jgi:hypothetical protein